MKSKFNTDIQHIQNTFSFISLFVPLPRSQNHLLKAVLQYIQIHTPTFLRPILLLEIP